MPGSVAGADLPHHPRRRRSRTLRAFALVGATALVLGACDHSVPYRTQSPDPLGPYQPDFPRRLTFSEGDDRSPSVQGSTLAFSRRDATRPDGDRCLAFLPVEGGTLTHSACPGGPLAVPDTIIDTWLLPAVSPALDRVAYVRESGIIVNVVPGSRQLVLAPVTAPADATLLLDTPYTLADGRVANQFDAIEWADSSTLRFVAGLEIVDAFARPADTTFVAFAVAEVDVATRSVTTVVGTDRAFTYVQAPGGGIWFVRRGESIVRTSSDGGLGAVADFGIAIRSIAEAAGMPVAIVSTPGPSGPSPTIASLNTATGVISTLWTGMFPVRLARVPGRPWIVAAIHRDVQLTRMGGGASLWLLEVR